MMPKQAIALATTLLFAWPVHASFIDQEHASKPLKTLKKATKKSRKKATRRKSSQVAYNKTASNQATPTSALTCMARNIYFEAGIESEKGKAAVANVTMNRVKSKHYPQSVCGVVFQKSRKACAFSWTCDRKGNVPPNNEAYRESEKIARLALSGALQDVTGNADHYHATYVRPNWSRKGAQKARIGRHIFYKLLDS